MFKQNTMNWSAANLYDIRGSREHLKGCPMADLYIPIDVKSSYKVGNGIQNGNIILNSFTITP